MHVSNVGIVFTVFTQIHYKIVCGVILATAR